MKPQKSILTALLLFLVLTAIAQQGINYKALIKDGSGNVLASSPVSIQFIIYEGVALTNNVYQESHTVNTDANGIVIVNIGEGSVISGNYTTIDWGADGHFLNVQVNTGSGLVDMGTTEFKAVPYAKQADTAETVVKKVTRTELDALTPVFGQIVYDLTDGVSLIWNGARWFKMTGISDCFPQPTTADAGSDQTITTSATSTTLAGNTPVEGTGTWSIITGTGGSFSDIHDPTATFSGNACAIYHLSWSISTVCTNNGRVINISFSELPTTANAGSDIYSPLQTTVNLSGNTPTAGTGGWSVISGTGGSFSNTNNANASFTGNNDTKYTLRWTTTSSCGNTSFDEVNVYLGNIIGQFRDGGIVFYVDGTGQHGLVCDISNQSAAWGCAGTAITGADGATIGTGAQNTIDIEAGCTTSGTAADICANLTLNGFTDWFLPSSDELNAMQFNKTTIDITAIEKGGSTFGTSYFMSSTESNDFNYTSILFSNGTVFSLSKSDAQNFRPVRAF